jgi:tRNA pseudouridine55 synthase
LRWGRARADLMGPVIATAASDGLVVVDKPAGLTSHDVVARMRRIAGTRRVGHAGTLDPMATGVLVLAVGSATRLLSHLDLGGKTYAARIRLGQATTTDDAEGETTTAVDATNVTAAQVMAARDEFVGDIMQVPSSVSAIKVAGERAYKRIRAGESVELAARPVTLSRFDVLAIVATGPYLDVDVEVDCSAGTYIRALARDLGSSLGVGGHLTMLRRLRVGGYGIDQAKTLDELAELADPVTVSMLAAVRTSMAVREVSPDELLEISFGRTIDSASPPGTAAAVGSDGTVAALLLDDGIRARPVLVFTAR